MTRFKWWLLGLITAIASTAFAGMYVGGELEKALLEKQSSDPTGVEARVYYDTTAKKAKIYNGTLWSELGSGGGGGGVVNLNPNPNAASGVDLGGTNDVGDYVASDIEVVPSQETSLTYKPLGDVYDTAIKLTYLAGTSDYVRLRFKVPLSSRNRKLGIFWYQYVSGFASTPSKVELYNYSDAYVSDEAEVVLQYDDSSGDSYIPNDDTVYRNYFDANDREYYEMRFVNIGVAGALYLNDVTITPSPNVVSGAAIGKWQTITLTPSDATNNTVTAYTRQIGDTAHIRGTASWSGAGAGTSYKLSLPSNYTPDSTKMPGSSTDNQIGSAYWFDSGTALYDLMPFYNTSASGIEFFETSGNPIWDGSQAASGDKITFDVNIPIAEWSGEAFYGNNNVEYAASTTGTWDAAASATNTIYGPAGAPITGSLGADRTKIVRFKTPIQATDEVYVQVQNQGNWLNVASTFPYVRQNTTYYGVQMAGVAGNDTDVSVYFARYVEPSGATYGIAGAAWSTSFPAWRVVKHSAGVPVGFGLADTSGNSGLVNPYSEGSGVIYTGTYVPTIANESNITSVTNVKHSYFRVGNTVFVSGRMSGSITTVNTDTQFTITLPVTSANFSAAEQAIGSGTVTVNTKASDNCFAQANSGAQNIILKLETTTLTGSSTWMYTFTYEIQ